MFADYLVSVRRAVNDATGPDLLCRRQALDAEVCLGETTTYAKGILHVCVEGVWGKGGGTEVGAGGA